MLSGVTNWSASAVRRDRISGGLRYIRTGLGNLARPSEAMPRQDVNRGPASWLVRRRITASVSETVTHSKRRIVRLYLRRTVPGRPIFSW